MFFIVINSVLSTNHSIRVRKHGVPGSPGDHSGKFPLVPVSVLGNAIDADRKDFRAELLKSGVFDGNCRHFRGSDISEIGWIEKQDDPFASICAEVDRSQDTLVICLSRKIWSLPSDLNGHTMILHLGNKRFRQFSPRSFQLPFLLRPSSPQRLVEENERQCPVLLALGELILPIV